MRFNFDLSERKSENQLARTPPSTSTPKEEVEWVPLQSHSIFSVTITAAEDGGAGHISSSYGMATNLMAWDGASRLYFWDSNRKCLHRISIRLGEPEPTSVLAASPSKVLLTDTELNFVVNKISINRNGSALLLTGLEGLCIMHLYGRTSAKDHTTICKTVSIGSDIYFDRNIRALQASWHPYSDSHLGILSSDSVFRLFDLSSSPVQPEQEYYLQPVEPGRIRTAAAIYPVDFSFGGDHLWDRFSVFVLFSDGSVYVLCPIVPFGSVYKWESVLEVFSDAETFGLKSANSKAVENSNMAISWLEMTFPELAHQVGDVPNLPALKAQPYALFDASISMQGPLQKVCHGRDEDTVQGAECEGRAMSFLYNSVSKDSILVTVWSGGQLQIDALADEIQPVWVVGNPPRLHVDPYDRIVGIAMICESILDELSVVKLNEPLDHTVWSGHPPPLLRLAIVDLALPRNRESNYHISLFVDPLIPERTYSVHGGGMDSIVLHSLPFTSQTSGKDDTLRAPSVYPILNTCQAELSSPSSLCGFVALSDSFGHSWIVGLTSSHECVVLEMETWNMLLSVPVEKEKKPTSLEEVKERDVPSIISKELLSGPNVVLLPTSSSNLRSLTADSIEGRSTLHQYFKLFHENYVEYAHKVYFELKHHAPQLKKIIDDQHARLNDAQNTLLKVGEKQKNIKDRIDNAIQFHGVLEARLQNLRNFPGAHRKPLTKAEREFKSELDRVCGVELDALHSSIEAVSARLKRYVCLPQKDPQNQQKPKLTRRKDHTQDDEISNLRSFVAKLSLVNGESTKKVKLVESALRGRENSGL